MLVSLDTIAYHNSILPPIKPDGTPHPLKHNFLEALAVFDALNQPSFEQTVPLHLVTARNANVHASALRPGMPVLVRRPCDVADRPHHTAPARVLGVHSREHTVTVEMRNGQRAITAELLSQSVERIMALIQVGRCGGGAGGGARGRVACLPARRHPFS